jgi:hypothetical protein
MRSGATPPTSVQAVCPGLKTLADVVAFRRDTALSCASASGVARCWSPMPGSRVDEAYGASLCGTAHPPHPPLPQRRLFNAGACD